jgi:lysophospholipase L1-like esterase
MSPFLTIIYEVFYAFIYFGLLFSKKTILQYFPNPSMLGRILGLVVLFNGFFIPYYLKKMKIRLTVLHYTCIALFCCLFYIFGSAKYYLNEMGITRFKQFHAFLQSMPVDQHVDIPKPLGVFRIICLGGSTTAEGSLSDNSYPRFLEELLSKKYPQKKIEVINAGHYFWTTQHSIIQYLFWLKDLDPDLIILFHACNDLIQSFTMPPYSSKPFRKDYGHFYGYLANLAYPKTFEKFIGEFFYADLRNPNLQSTSFSDFKSIHSFQRNLETLIEITKSKKIHLILSNQAHFFTDKNETDIDFLWIPKHFLVDDEHYADEKSWYAGMELFNRVTRETADKFSIPFVDQVSLFNRKRTREIFTDAHHMTPKGRMLKANLFFEKILELKLLEGKDN